ncbi:TonB-dependent receptor [Chitinimonas sp.]|uniref:TonB-dependent receptor n=1 Tax=Chitinimonas sp. TaxID=1934313 RepID=UPI0035B0FC95
MKTTPVLAALAAAGLASCVFADGSPNLIQVTASRFPGNAADQPVNLTVISRDDIARSAATSLPELLAGVAGVTVRNLDSTGNGSIDLAGFGISGPSNTLVLLDGIKLNDNDLSSPRLTAIALDRIERIEIVRGGAVAWGGGATGGVINLITRKGNRGEWSARVGSFGTVETNAGAGFGDTLNLRLDGRALHSNGFRANGDHDARSASSELAWRDAGLRLAVGLAREEDDYRFPGARSVKPATAKTPALDQFRDDPWGSNSPNDWGKTDNTRLTLRGEGQFAGGNWALDASHRRKNTRSYFDYGGGFSSDDQRHIDDDRISPRAAFHLGAAELALGVDIGRSKTRLANGSAMLDAGRSKVDNRALWLDAGYRLGADTRFTLGGRSEKVDQDVNVLQYGSPVAAKRNDRVHAVQFGVRQRFGELSLFARAGSSYRLANADELVDNANLQPQTSRDIDAGVEGRFGPGQWRFSAFSRRLDHEIAYQPFAGPNGYGQNTNLSPTRRQGLNAEWSASVGAFDYGVNISWQDASFRSGNYGGGDLAGKQVPLVPRWQGNLRAGWACSEATRLDVALHGSGHSRLDNDQGNTGPWLGGFATLDIKLSHRIGATTLSLSGQNLGDKRYASYGVRSTFNANYNLYPEAGRRWQASLAYAF